MNKLFGMFLIAATFAAFAFLPGCATSTQETTTTTATSSTTSTTVPASSAIIRLYYTFPTDPFGEGKSYDSQNFGSAYSANGVDFTKDSGVRFGPAANLSDPDVFNESVGKWVLFYSKAVSPVTAEAMRLYKATATASDGAFVNDSSFTGGELGNISSTIKIGSAFYVYLFNNGIKIATYVPASNNLALAGTAQASGVDPSVIQLSAGAFKMYYKISGDTYCSDSSDGLSWGVGTKVVSDAEVPGAVYVGGKIYLYYISSDPSDPNIGKTLVRISADNGATFGTAQVVTGLHDAACDPAPVAY